MFARNRRVLAAQSESCNQYPRRLLSLEPLEDRSVPSLLETISVPVSGATVHSSTVLQTGVSYTIVASGTANIANSFDFIGDAEYYFLNAPPYYPEDYSGSDQIDLGIAINDDALAQSKFPRWGDFRPDHTYSVEFVGLGATIRLNYHDSQYADNSGSLTVKIYGPDSDIAIQSAQYDGDRTVQFDFSTTGNPGAFDVGLYRSTDGTTYNPADLIATKSITPNPSGGSASDSFALSAPISATQDYPFLLVVADPSNAISELDEDNNSAPILLPAIPDLTGIFTPVLPPATAGKDMPVELDINNYGQATAAGTISIGFYLSTDGVLDNGDVRIGTSSVQINLLPGQSVHHSATLTIPDSFKAGVFHLIAKVDDGVSAIDEGNEDNNAADSGPFVIRRLSGPEWGNLFHDSLSLSDLDPAFGSNVGRFINRLQAAGLTLGFGLDSTADIRVLATRRPLELAYLMHWSYVIATGQDENHNPVSAQDVDNLPGGLFPGVYIDWWHGNDADSISAAKQLAAALGLNLQKLRVPPSLTSNHTRGLAIDMSITWSGKLTVVDNNNVQREIKGGPRDSTNKDLIDIAATFGVFHFLDVQKDENHWSVDGH